MLNKIIRFSLNHKLFILVAAILLVIAGIYSTREMDIDVFPDLTAPTVVVMTDAHGMAPEEVEKLVTFPLETALNGATNVRRVRSSSRQGSSFVFVEFDWGMDPYRARQIVSEKLTTLSDQLPEGVAPVMAPQSSVMGEILFVGLQVSPDSLGTDSAHATSLMELRTLAEWVVKPAILSTGGVSQVTIIGGDYKEYQIEADPLRMRRYGIDMHQLAEAASALCENASGGVVRDFGNEYSLIAVGRTSNPEELAATLVSTTDGHPVTIGDVADIVVAPAVKQGFGSMNGTPAIILSISKQPNINTLDVTENIEANLASVAQTLPPDVQMNTHIFRQADFISNAVGNVGSALLEGALFVIIVLLLFLGSVRTTLISLVSIPISLLGTMLTLHLLGLEINTMTLGGLCIAIGSLVDDAIIDVENVYKRLHENHRLPAEAQLSATEVVFRGSSEIRSSIIHATFIIMLSFVPLFFLSGLEGRMLKPLGIAYIVSLFWSLVVALTLTPLLCRLLLSSPQVLNKAKASGRIATLTAKHYGRWLGWTLDHPKPIVAGTLALLVVAVVMLLTMGRGFLPDFNEGSLTIAVVARPGISLEENNRLGQMVEQQLISIPEVTATARRTGRGELDEHSQTSNGAEVDVAFTLQKRSKEEFMQEVRHRLAEVPGIVVSVGQPLGHRIDHMVSGTQAAIALKVFGPDLSQLYLLGNEIKSATAGIEGLVDVNVEQQTETPQIQIRPNRQRMAQYGIPLAELNEYIALLFEGEAIGSIYEGERAFPLTLRLHAMRQGEAPTTAEVEDALYPLPGGGTVPLSEIAEIVSVGGPATIGRENVQRKLVVSANVTGRDATSVVSEMQERIAERVSLPQGYRLQFDGQFQTAARSARTLLLVFLAALVTIYLLLYTEFGDWALSAIVLLNLPLALIGGVVAVRFTSGLITISALIGFITLFGIATRNGILLVARYQSLQQQGLPLRKVIVEGSLSRIIPIAMTALTTALSLIPMALAADRAGNEIQAPMAIVVLGGLISSTLLNIFVIPIVFQYYCEKKSSRSTSAIEAKETFTQTNNTSPLV